MSLERRIGGVRAGSAGLVYTLDTAGQWLTARQQRIDGQEFAPRRAEQPSARLLNHSLGLSEICVQLVEQQRNGMVRLLRFDIEPACWVGNGVGGWLKPDALAVVAGNDVSDYWWIEHDEATESLPTIRRKLTAYLDFVRRGQRGPDGVMPRVLVSVPSPARRDALERVIAGLPDPAGTLFAVVTHEQAAANIGECLRI